MWTSQTTTQVFGCSAYYRSDPQVFGIEVELENVVGGMPEGITDSWRVVEDGSLRNWGREFVSSPRTIEAHVPNIAHLWDAMSRRGWRSSERTGVHIHMNLSGHTLGGLHKVLVAMAVLEPALMYMCGPEREQNIFCVPWYRDPSPLHNFVKWITTEERPRARIPQLHKYTALNLLSMFTFGTLEFRGLPVYEDPGKLVTMLYALEKIIRRAGNYPSGEQIYAEFEARPDQMVRDFMSRFPRQVHGAMLDKIEYWDSLGVAERCLVRTRSESNYTWDFDMTEDM